MEPNSNKMSLETKLSFRFQKDLKLFRVVKQSRKNYKTQ